MLPISPAGQTLSINFLDSQLIVLELCPRSKVSDGATEHDTTKEDSKPDTPIESDSGDQQDARDQPKEGRVTQQGALSRNEVPVLAELAVGVPSG